MHSDILAALDDSLKATNQLKEPAAIDFMEQSTHLIVECFQRGNKLIIAGNGGSLCDASHFAEELTGFFRQKRRALPAIVLNDSGHLTCVSNDIGFDFVFSRGVEAFGKPGDVFIGLTTSGNSPNIINAFTSAKKMGLKTISFLGKGGGQLRDVADHQLIIDGFSTSDRIQEAHMVAIHIIIEMIEKCLFAVVAPESLMTKVF